VKIGKGGKLTFRDVFEAFKSNCEQNRRGEKGWIFFHADVDEVHVSHCLYDEMLEYIVSFLKNKKLQLNLFSLRAYYSESRRPN